MSSFVCDYLASSLSPTYYSRVFDSLTASVERSQYTAHKKRVPSKLELGTPMKHTQKKSPVKGRTRDSKESLVQGDMNAQLKSQDME
jgi:hypothetical protein